MRQTATNEFKDGLNLDLHPIVTPNSVLTDNLNGTFITYNGNEFCLQNDRGNKEVSSIPNAFIPIGAKEYNGVIYIVCSDSQGNNLIGHYPGLEIENGEYAIKGTLQNTFTPLQNLCNSFTDLQKKDFIGKFGWTTNTPVTIDIQPSYDGSVNLILVADGCKTRIINSGFSVQEDNKYEIITRNQKVETNLYNLQTFDQDTNLIRTNNKLTKIHLKEVKGGGQLKGGNYTFYIKFGDGDFNQTDVVAESGIVSIFNGTDGAPSTISGTLLDERTDKIVGLTLFGLNHVYSKIYVYFTREYSDTQGYRMTESGMLKEPFDMVKDSDEQVLWITGYEQQQPINIEELNVDYHTIDWARAESQHSDMLFLGNIGQKETFELYRELDKFTKGVSTKIKSGQMIDILNGDTFWNDRNYYSTKNIYFSLGYWPEEWYRFGIVYILDDGSTTPVFNMEGYVFKSQTNKTNPNDYGVFKTPYIDVLGFKKPIYFEFTLPDISFLPDHLLNKIKGWFVVRQKRIPTTICQALTIGTDKRSHLPVLKANGSWHIESFLSLDRDHKGNGEKWKHKKGDATIYPVDDEHILRPFLETFDDPTPQHNKLNYRFIKEENDHIYKNALLSLDPCVNSLVGSMFDGSKFIIQREHLTTCSINGLVFNYATSNQYRISLGERKVVLVRENTKSKVVDDSAIFSNVAGTGSSAGDFEYSHKPFGIKTQADGILWDIIVTDRYYEKDDRVDEDYGTMDYHGYNSTHNVNLIRGLFTPYLGISGPINDSISDIPSICSIRLASNASDEDCIKIRQQDNSEYYSVTDRQDITESTVQAYRGDCYICKVGMRILKNFIDNTAPVTDTIVDPLGWERWVRQRSLYGGDDQENTWVSKDSDSYANIVDYSEVNLSDLNAVDLGYWVTFECLSSYNLGLRSQDTLHVDEMSLMGSARSFYPLSGASASNKVGDSYLLNDGLSATVGRKRHIQFPDVPYSKSEFSNRIMFSNVNVTDAYTNGYRTFQGLSYKDYDKQYGAITKLIPLGQNLFIVMEHGLGMVPVNPKALIQTTTGDAIHIYGYGVLPDEMTIISQDYGSKYEHSVIRTPIGIYGIDTDARKIWCFSDKQGFKTISDMKIESYLNDNLFTGKSVNITTCDVRTHYNSLKGDIMFTFYNKQNTPEIETETEPYFRISTNNITIRENEVIYIPYYTNIPDSDITIYNGSCINCNLNGGLYIKGVAVGNTQITINNNTINVNVIEEGAIDDTPLQITLSKYTSELKVGQSDSIEISFNKDNIDYSNIEINVDDSILSYELNNNILNITCVGQGYTNLIVKYDESFIYCSIIARENIHEANSILINPRNIEVKKGQIFEIAAMGLLLNDKNKNKSFYGPVSWDPGIEIVSNSNQIVLLQEGYGQNYRSIRNIYRAGNIPGTYTLTVKRKSNREDVNDWSTDTCTVIIKDETFEGDIAYINANRYQINFVQIDEDDDSSYSDMYTPTSSTFKLKLQYFNEEQILSGRNGTRLNDLSDIRWTISKPGIISNITVNDNVIDVECNTGQYGITQLIFYLDSNPTVYWPMWVGLYGGPTKDYASDIN